VIYQDDPDAAPDEDFAPGRLADLVVGNRGRLLDPRRTPVTIVALRFETGEFRVRVEAFEDAGALWDVPFEDAERFQFARGGATTDTAALQAAVDRFDRPLAIGGDPPAPTSSPPAATVARLVEEREAAREFVLPLPELESYVAERMGEPALFDALEAFLDARGVLDLERAFTERFVSNPWSGELVKGHAIVLAKLGLCPFRGKVVRDPALFEGAWSRSRRAAHIRARLAFVAELYGGDPVTVYRGTRVPREASFVSASFSRAVAASNGTVAELTVAPERVFMTFMETRALNGRYREAEAVLLGTVRV